MTEKYQPIPHRLKNMAVGGHVAGAEDIDAGNGKTQQDINADTYRKDETYSKEQLNNMITTPEQKYENYTAEDGDTFSDLGLPAEGEADTTYRVGSWDGTEYNASKFSEYSWDGTQYIPLSVQSPGIDDEPTAGSSNLVKSGSTYTFGGVGNAVLALGDSGDLTDIRSRFTTWTDGYIYVGAEGAGGRTKGGAYTNSTLYVYSNYVDVSDLVGKYILVTIPVSSTDVVGIALYDSNQDHVSSYKKNIESYNVFAIRGIFIPEGVKYLRTTFYKASLSNFACKYSDTNGVIGTTEILRKYIDNSHSSYLTNSRCYKIRASMPRGNVSVADGSIASTTSDYFVATIEVQSSDNTVYVKGANHYVSNYGMAGYINGTFYAGHKINGDEVIDIADWVAHGVNSIKISSSTNCTISIGTDNVAHSLLNKRNVITVPVDTTSGNRNVSSEDGSFVSSTYGTHYANEIDLENVTLIEIDHLLSYRGNYGYAYLDDNDNVIYSKRLSGQTTITTNKLLSLRNQGATKLRISVSNASTIRVTKMVSGSAIEDIYTRLDDNNERKSECFYNYIGSKKLYLPSSLPDANNFASLTAIYDAYDELHTQYPTFMSEAAVLGVDESGSYNINAYSLGFQYPLITNDRGGNNDNLFDNYNINKRHVLVTSGVHPTEKNSIEGTYLAIKEILESNEDWAMFIKNNFIIDIVPVINPWGVVNNSSKNVNDVNLNRDYDEQTQAETQIMCAYVNNLKEKGLVGIVDLHNTTTGNGYLVTKDWYKYFDYYVVLTQQISSEMYDVLKEVYGTTKQNNFHTWLASETGQLHEYANSIDVLGVTVEFNSNVKSPTLTKTACINIINQFATFEGLTKDVNPD